MTVHPLTTERELLSAQLAEELMAAAAQVVERQQGDLGGFVVIGWGDLSGVTVRTEIGGARIPAQLIPQMVEEAVRQDIATRNALNALQDLMNGQDGAA